MPQIFMFTALFLWKCVGCWCAVWITRSLVCTVAYTHKHNTLTGPGEVAVVEDRKFFRKFFKFSVNKPLDVKTKAYNLKVWHLKCGLFVCGR